MYAIVYQGGGKMAGSNYYSLCQQYRGRAVEIRTFDGMVHQGVISHVDYNSVYLQPLWRNKDLGGFGYGYRPGFGAGIALGSIATLALLPLFFV